MDPGECEAIALALELGAERLLVDERQGREAAQARGLKVAGTLAVILGGASRGLFDGQAVIEKLGRTSFYDASPELLAAVSEKEFRVSHRRGSPHSIVPKIVPTTIQNNQINPTQTKKLTVWREGNMRCN